MLLRPSLLTIGFTSSYQIEVPDTTLGCRPEQSDRTFYDSGNVLLLH